MCVLLLPACDNLGKTSILANLVLSTTSSSAGGSSWNEGPLLSDVSTLPTVGYQLVNLQRRNIKWNIWDVSGAGKFRSLWPALLAHVHAVVFVIDASDRQRLAVARDELRRILATSIVKVRRLPLLLLVNKSDISTGCLTLDEVSVAMGLRSIQLSNPARAVSTSAKTLAGMEDAMQWLTSQVRCSFP
jgi:GTPase SAR1 family protein